MRMSRTHKVAVTAVMTTIATATVLTFTRADTAPADRIASLPQASNDAPVVERRAPATSEPAPKPEPSTTTPAPKVDPAPAPAPKPSRTPDEPAKPTSKPPPTPAPSPSPTPPKNLLEILLGQ
ncbi:hypothetical protein [Aeromicrobium sp. NPDC092404]|uniref:hypothetical protein n=1 Tax=Aeromicrobium sp. NPDC092404 TaxID=3154976 RepID=UPI00343B1856